MDFSQSYWHLTVFAVSFLAGLALVVWQAGENVSRFALANNVIQDMNAVVVVSAAVAILGVDGVKMFAESFLQKRYLDGLKAGERRILDTLVKERLITDQQRREIEEKNKEK